MRSFLRSPPILSPSLPDDRRDGGRSAAPRARGQRPHRSGGRDATDVAITTTFGANTLRSFSVHTEAVTPCRSPQNEAGVDVKVRNPTPALPFADTVVKGSLGSTPAVRSGVRKRPESALCSRRLPGAGRIKMIRVSWDEHKGFAIEYMHHDHKLMPLWSRETIFTKSKFPDLNLRPGLLRTAETCDFGRCLA
jgi:hypothetical protein